MDLQSIMSELESRGTEQNRSVYGRHGVTGPMFGVSYAHLADCVREIGVDHDLALQLWDTGNHDARVLASMIADPARTTSDVIEGWAGRIDNYVLADAVAKLAGKVGLPRESVESWCRSDVDWLGQVGWTVISLMALPDSGADDGYLRDQLRVIEERLPSAGNRTRHSMNGAIIAIGLRSPALQEAAIETARRIGKIEVDHGATDCKTPDAEEYILRSIQRREMMASRSSGEMPSIATGSTTKTIRSGGSRTATKPARKAVRASAVSKPTSRPTGGRKKKKAAASRRRVAAKKRKKAATSRKRVAGKTRPIAKRSKHRGKKAGKKVVRKPKGKPARRKTTAKKKRR